MSHLRTSFGKGKEEGAVPPQNFSLSFSLELEVKIPLSREDIARAVTLLEDGRSISFVSALGRPNISYANSVNSVPITDNKNQAISGLHLPGMTDFWFSMSYEIVTRSWLKPEIFLKNVV
ncbi:hypothetical protein ANN_19212 [Periplaneta americana]|uniref:Per a allergen n=1 Tax=Periplaneta americana TaxID=6978 RepID=A0ABQ8S9J5_PERAM|nr:hypothetical protein ANN_19212 [Periplaneta americana]